eukprot:TRINITY_DN20926_c0_g1_i1.p1 TRINITY_DN20926_c0_g1~~TRINITY_DN20926_c0_g1_i1.p1  ORF type:complete len:369 (-),score=85.01 TRINITY_DN20926_c0_g1_i1:329-1435(-)
MAAIQHCKPVLLRSTILSERGAVEHVSPSQLECTFLKAKMENLGEISNVGGNLTVETRPAFQASHAPRSFQQTRLDITAMAPQRKEDRRGGYGKEVQNVGKSSSLSGQNLLKLEEAKEQSDSRWRKAFAELALASIASATLLLSTPGAVLAEDLECAPTAEVNRVIVIASIAEAAGLIGAGVGGYVARKRKDELEKINGQLRQINLSLRRQARVETYAPSLSYAPVAVPVGAPRPRAPSEPRDDANKGELMRHLKAGKKCLRENNAQAAFVEFEKALALARKANDTVEEKKAARGLGASAQRQRNFKEAIGYHQLVLKISRRTGEQSGDTEAIGAIADCYTELGDLENGAKYYDRYIARLEADDDEVV